MNFPVRIVHLRNVDICPKGYENLKRYLNLYNVYGAESRLSVYTVFFIIYICDSCNFFYSGESLIDSAYCLRLENRSCIDYVLLSAKICIIDTSVVDRHRFDAGPDPDFHVDADPDPIRIRIGIRTMPILMRILPQVLHTMGNQKIFLYPVTTLPVYNVVSLSSVSGVP